MSRFFKLFAVVLLCMTTLGGCEKNDVTEISIPTTSATVELEAKVSAIDPEIIVEIKWLIQSGLIPVSEYDQRLETVLNKKKTTDLLGDGYYVAPHYVYTRKMVQDMMNGNYSSGSLASDKQARHRRQSYMADTGSKSVRMHHTLIAAWKTATTQAISAWNGLGYSISFVGSSPATYSELSGAIDITTAHGNNYDVPDYVYAFTVPVACNGCVGELININVDYDAGTYGSTTPDSRKMIMAHELGHAIGLQHTDSILGSDVSLSITCNGASGYTDFNSVMRSDISNVAPWTGFTTCDKRVINYYWW